MTEDTEQPNVQNGEQQETPPVNEDTEQQIEQPDVPSEEQRETPSVVEDTKPTVDAAEETTAQDESEQSTPQDAQSPMEPSAEQEYGLNPEQPNELLAEEPIDEEPDPEAIQREKKRKQMNLLIGVVASLMVVLFIVILSGMFGAVQNSNQTSSDQSAADAGTAVSESNDADSFNYQTGGAVGTTGTQSALTAGTFNNSANSADSQSKQEESQATDQTKNGVKISREKFDYLQIGMTYDEVAAVIGGNGALTVSTGNMQVYEWAGHGSSDGSFARLTFKSGKLNKKYQYGL